MASARRPSHPEDRSSVVATHRGLVGRAPSGRRSYSSIGGSVAAVVKRPPHIGSAAIGGTGRAAQGDGPAVHGLDLAPGSRGRVTPWPRRSRGIGRQRHDRYVEIAGPVGDDVEEVRRANSGPLVGSEADQGHLDASRIHFIDLLECRADREDACDRLIGARRQGADINRNTGARSTLRIATAEGSLSRPARTDTHGRWRRRACRGRSVRRGGQQTEAGGHRASRQTGTGGRRAGCPPGAGALGGPR